MILEDEAKMMAPEFFLTVNLKLNAINVNILTIDIYLNK